jgi:glutaredoxin 3
MTMGTVPAANAAILLYTTGWCPSCARAKALLERKGLKYREINVEDDPGQRAEMMTRSGRRTVPQIFIGETHVGGFDELYALEQAGRLAPLVSASKA